MWNKEQWATEMSWKYTTSRSQSKVYIVCVMVILSLNHHNKTFSTCWMLEKNGFRNVRLEELSFSHYHLLLKRLFIKRVLRWTLKTLQHPKCTFPYLLDTVWLFIEPTADRSLKAASKLSTACCAGFQCNFLFGSLFTCWLVSRWNLGNMRGFQLLVID